MQHYETPDAIGAWYIGHNESGEEDGVLQAPPLEMQQIFTPFFWCVGAE